MANIKTTIDEWEVKDLEDNSTFSVCVLHNTEMGNNAQPGIQVICAGKIVNYEPLHTERWAYASKKANQAEHFIEDGSWTAYEDTFIKHFLVTDGGKLKAKIEVKVRSKDAPVVKEYELPFTI